MIDIQIFNKIDQALMGIGKGLKPLSYSEPTNEPEQKRKFLDGTIRNPSFLYKELEYDPQDVKERLNAIEIPDGKLGKVYEKKRRNALLENKIIIHRGDEDIVRESTILMHGSPDRELVEYADSLLLKIDPIIIKTPLTSDIARDALQQALYGNGLTDWTTELSKKKSTTVYTGEKKMTVCEDRKFSEGAIKRLKVHDIIHALRGANGYAQPLSIFVLGFPGYMSTEEGLTTYFEQITGNSNDQMKREYAARVIAVDSVCQGLNFRRAFNRLKDYGLTDNKAWDTAVRTYRAGGYVKDHVYLQGNRLIYEFVENGGDIKELFVGKIGIDDLPLVRRLREKGIVKEPVYLPSFLE